MKIESLKVHNFVGIPDAELIFKKPVALITGPNSASKSSLKDALLFAFTGKSRAVKKFKDAKQLAHKGKDDMQVQVAYLDKDKNPCTITRSLKNASKGVEFQDPYIPFCLNPQAFIDLPPRDRGAILSAILGAGLNELVEAAMAEHVGDIQHEEIIAAIRASGIDRHNVDALRALIVDLRRTYKREADNQSAKEPTLDDYDLPEDFDVAEAEHQYKDEKAKKIETLTTYSRHKVMAAELKGKIKTWTARAKEKRAAIELLTDAEKELLKSHLTLNAIRDFILRAYDDSLGIDAEIPCYLCNTKVTQKTMMDKANDCQAGLEASQDAVDAIKDRDMANERLEREAVTAENGVEEFKQKLEGLVLIDSDEDLEAAIVTAKGEQAEKWNQIMRYRTYLADVDNYKNSQKRVGNLKDYVVECNRVDEALKDGGPVKSAIAEGGKPLPIMKKLLDVWGLDEFTWMDNGEIEVFGRPVNQASASEQYRTACIMGLALAEAAGVGICGLDGFEILVGDKANDFFDVVQDCKLNNVFVFASSEKDYTKIKNVPKWLEIYLASEGNITKL